MNNNIYDESKKVTKQKKLESIGHCVPRGVRLIAELSAKFWLKETAQFTEDQNDKSKSKSRRAT